jgi:DNA-binding MarR family transcriptional regulator
MTRSGMAVRMAEVLASLHREIALNRDFVDDKEAAFLSMVWTWSRIESVGRGFFASLRITEAQFNALMILWDYRAVSLRQHELAELLVVNRASMGGVIDRLERNGWVKRTADPQDRRASVVVLTERGIEKLNEVRTPYYRLLAATFEDMGRDELLAVMEFNDGLRKRLDALPAAVRAPVRRRALAPSPAAPPRTRGSPAP